MDLVKKKLKKLKLESFFIRHLLQEGYGPRYWWPYAKNRFFGNYLFRGLPRYEYKADPDFELHTICGKQDLWMLAWMLRSFLIMSKLKPVIVIHDDGSMDTVTAELIQSKFDNVKFMFRGETTKRILEMRDLPDIIKKARMQCHFFLDKVIDTLVFSKAKRIVASDTDVLFYKPPVEIIDFVTGKTDCDALIHRQISDNATFDLMMDDFYSNKYKLKESKTALLNSGFFAINRDKFNLDQLVEFLTHVKRPLSDYFIEMNCVACLFAQVNFQFLSPERYAVKGFLNDKMVLKHYTSPRRYEMFAYGIDAVKKAMEAIGPG